MVQHVNGLRVSQTVSAMLWNEMNVYMRHMASHAAHLLSRAGSSKPMVARSTAGSWKLLPPHCCRRTAAAALPLLPAAASPRLVYGSMLSERLRRLGAARSIAIASWTWTLAAGSAHAPVGIPDAEQGCSMREASFEETAASCAEPGAATCTGAAADMPMLSCGVVTAQCQRQQASAGAPASAPGPQAAPRR